MSESSSAFFVNRSLNRRAFLQSAGALVPGASLLLQAGLAAGQEDAADARIVRSKEPLNLEFPFASLDSFITSNDRFYVRNHFPIPKMDVPNWKLKVEGAVKKELALTYDQLRKLPSRTVTSTVECAGNNRAWLTPKAKGVQWDLGAVSTAEWTGVPLSAVLDVAGLADNAVEVVMEGADRGEVGGDLRPANPVLNFTRSLPLTKARKPEVILAYQMNGKDLPVKHGHPLRAIVPGWYGMASIKWLQRIIVTQTPFNGFFQTIDYSYFSPLKGLPRVLPIQEMEVKAEIARPAPAEVLPRNTEYRIRGAAWSGESDVTKVELSFDAGKSWTEAMLTDKAVRFAWRRWEHAWHAPEKAGAVTLLARATDAAGRVQPLLRDADRRNYLISHSLPIQIMVK